MPALELYPYQKRWLEDASRWKIGMFARQTGKTFTTTLEIVLDVLKAESENRRSNWVILSRGDRQAKEAMREGVHLHLKAMQAGFEAFEAPFDARITSQEVVLPGGSLITAIPANADTARGYSRNVFLDEFAIHRDARAIWGALFPVASRSGLRIRITSTPKGKGNKFYELMTAQGARWSRHVVDIHQAVADGLPRNVQELKEGMADDELWRQEFELQWVDEASAWLPYELIYACEDKDAGLPETYAGGPCFVGVDIAARGDLFVIWVLEAVGDVAWTREIIARRGVPFSEQDALLDQVFRKYKVVRCCMDQTGMGEKPVEDAKRRHGEMRVEGVLFTGPNKLALATVGKETFEDRKIRIPEGSADLRADLHKLQKVVGPTGTPRFLADSDSAGHADRAWACFLATSAAATPSAPIDFQSLGLREGASELRVNEDRGFGTVGGGADMTGF
jgi:phage FluMu gp28-like protein